MGLFTHNTDFNQPEWKLLQNSCLNLYMDESSMNRDIEKLKEKKYKVIEFDVASWSNKEDIDNAFLQIGAPYDNCSNLNALKDCVAELNLPDMSDAVLVFRGFDNLIAILGRDYAEGFLDIVAAQARNYLLFGVRLIVLLSAKGDPNLYSKSGGSFITLQGR